MRTQCYTNAFFELAKREKYFLILFDKKFICENKLESVRIRMMLLYLKSAIALQRYNCFYLKTRGENGLPVKESGCILDTIFAGTADSRHSMFKCLVKT